MESGILDYLNAKTNNFRIIDEWEKFYSTDRIFFDDHKYSLTLIPFPFE
jgi:hypothetical protein